jgi:signal transduction histidine kinase
MLKTNPDAKIVVVTAYDQRGLRDAAKEAGAAHYVPKDNLIELRTALNLPPIKAPVPPPASGSSRNVQNVFGSSGRSPVAQLAARVDELELFPAFVANELRAPLRTIESSISVLKGHTAASLPTEASTCIQHVEAACVQMNERIEALFSFADSGRAAIRWEDFAPDQLVRRVWEEISQRTPTDRVCFKLFRMPAIAGDRNLLRLAFTHLLDNALKFSATRTSPVVEVSCCDVGSYSVFAVTDNGIGFEMEHVNKLFLPLSRLPGSEKYPGIGLGLALSRRIVQQHGGRIWAEGRPGEGTTIYFTLPRPPATAMF